MNFAVYSCTADSARWSRDDLVAVTLLPSVHQDRLVHQHRTHSRTEVVYSLNPRVAKLKKTGWAERSLQVTESIRGVKLYLKLSLSFSWLILNLLRATAAHADTISLTFTQTALRHSGWIGDPYNSLAETLHCAVIAQVDRRWEFRIHTGCCEKQRPDPGAEESGRKPPIQIPRTSLTFN